MVLTPLLNHCAAVLFRLTLVDTCFLCQRQPSLFIVGIEEDCLLAYWCLALEAKKQRNELIEPFIP